MIDTGGDHGKIKASKEVQSVFILSTYRRQPVNASASFDKNRQEQVGGGLFIR